MVQSININTNRVLKEVTSTYFSWEIKEARFADNLKLKKGLYYFKSWVKIVII